MVKKSSILTAIAFLLLVGCGTKGETVYVDRPVYVDVPVTQEVSLTAPKKPVNYLLKIKKTSTPKQVAEAYVNTIKEQNAYIAKLETLLAPFLKK